MKKLAIVAAILAKKLYAAPCVFAAVAVMLDGCFSFRSTSFGSNEGISPVRLVATKSADVTLDGSNELDEGVKLAENLAKAKGVIDVDESDEKGAYVIGGILYKLELDELELELDELPKIDELELDELELDELSKIGALELEKLAKLDDDKLDDDIIFFLRIIIK